MLLGDIGGEGFFSAATVVLAAASAVFAAAVLDAPAGMMGKVSIGVSLGFFKPETRAVGSTRHSPLMRSIAASVV